MSKSFYYFLLILLFVGIIVLTYCLVNTSVSLKYETAGGDDCISLANGKNLCSIIKSLRALLIVSVLGLLTLLVFKNKILKGHSR
jgi:hypothetical protein